MDATLDVERLDKHLIPRAMLIPESASLRLLGSIHIKSADVWQTGRVSCLKDW